MVQNPTVLLTPKLQEQPLLDLIKLIHSSFPELINLTELMIQNKWEKIVIIPNKARLRKNTFLLLFYNYLWTLKTEFLKYTWRATCACILLMHLGMCVIVCKIHQIHKYDEKQKDDLCAAASN